MSAPESDSVVRQIREWLEPLSRWQGVDKLLNGYAKGFSTDWTRRDRLRLYTDNNRYQISIRPPVNGDGGYLGCTSTSRSWRAGEDWHRGSDLHDGDFSEETWNKIISDILAHELVAPVERQQPEKTPQTPSVEG